MTPSDYERARTWMLEIASTILPDTSWRDAGPERVYAHTGGLSIDRGTGAWFCHGAGVGGYSPVGLLRFVKDWNSADATAWVIAFLAAHPGTGAATGGTEAGTGDAAAYASRSRAEDVLAALTPVEGTTAETNLSSRGLVPPYPECIGFVADARVGEAALVAKLEAHGRVTGIQVTYLDPDGRKSLALPVRRRLDLEKSPGAGFLLRSAASGPILVAEGLEDALSLATLEAGPVIGLPGIAALRHLELPIGTAVVVFRDGDDPKSAAAAGLIAGVDHLLLTGVAVRVTATPPGEDANSILQASGPDALLQLIADAVPAELSLDGDIRRISRLDSAEYERERRMVSKKHGVRLGFIDDAAGKYRRQTEAEAPEDTPSNDDPVWDGDPVVLSDVLDAALKEVSRYVVAEKTKLATAVLWAVHTHLAHHAFVRLQISPRLGIQTKTPGCGKTTLLEFVLVLSFRGTMKSSVTASSFMRTMSVTKRTYFLDEGDRQITERAPEAFILMLNAGHRRSSSLVECSVPTADGGWKVAEFDCWGAVAVASIGELPATIQERSVIISLQRATGAEVPEHLRDGTAPELVTIRRQLAAWADGLFELPESVLPDILMRQAGRVGDNWRPLIAIADLAGGQWPALARQAALEEVAAEKQQTQTERLLMAIRRAFDRQPATLPADAPDNQDRMRTATLLSALLADLEEDWGAAHRGRAITASWLRERLRGLLGPAGAQEWRTPGPARVHCRGYLRLQFADSWRRYMADADAPETSFPDPHPAPGTPGTPGSSGTVAQSSADFGVEKPVPGAQAEDSIRDSDNTPESQDIGQPVPDDPGVPGVPDGLQGRGNIKKPGKRGTNRAPRPATNGSAAEAVPDEEEGTGAVELAAQIQALRAANPTKSIQWIAKHIGQPADVVRIYLGEDDQSL